MLFVFAHEIGVGSGKISIDLAALRKITIIGACMANSSRIGGFWPPIFS